jgi:hypothetical protein
MADDIVISARVDTTEAMRDLAKLEQDRTVDVEVQPINVEATIKAIDQRLSRLNTQLVIAVAEDNTKSGQVAAGEDRRAHTAQDDADHRGRRRHARRYGGDRSGRAGRDGHGEGQGGRRGGGEGRRRQGRRGPDRHGEGQGGHVGGRRAARRARQPARRGRPRLGAVAGRRRRAVRAISGGAVGGATKLAVAGGAIAGSFAKSSRRWARS